jgi:hypothetical protein
MIKKKEEEGVAMEGGGEPWYFTALIICVTINISHILAAC